MIHSSISTHEIQISRPTKVKAQCTVCIISVDLTLGDMIMSGRTDDRIAKDSLPFLCQFMGFHEKEVRQK